MSLLIDTVVFEPHILESSEDGIMRIEGVFQRAGTKNANGRVYSRNLWEKVLAEKSSVKVRIKERAMLGHLEHPADGVTDLRKGAIIITKLSLDEKNQVIGRAEILDTPDGKIVQEYVKKKIRIGVSSRGSGTVGSDGVVSESDYKLETFDLVYNPSTPGAHPTVKEGEEMGFEEKRRNNDKERNMSKPVEALKGLECSLSPLLEQSVSGLLPYQISEIDGKLLEASVQLGAMIVETPEITGAVNNLVARLNEKRNELSTVLSGRDEELDEELDEDLSLDTEDLDEDLDEDEVLVSVADVEEVLEDANEEESKIAVLKSVNGELKELREKLEAAEALQLTTALRVKTLQKERDVALALLGEAIEESEADEVSDAINECIEEDEQLSDVIDLLEESTSAEEVFRKAVAISKAISKKNKDRKINEDDDFEDEELDEDLFDENDDFKQQIRQDLFEGLDGLDDLESEDDVSKGILESTYDSDSRSHKGRRLAASAISKTSTRR